ncbi:hypothetical protein [Sphingobium sp.]|uniref:hypothetical protein n=1 Tax=Sphingobium TaxID=165695 RepID=UPI001A2137DF|nr:hypothetical protein [Sphingobium sp.]MBJ7376383.1 hypothetical protein [Sphingobium sp.]
MARWDFSAWPVGLTRHDTINTFLATESILPGVHEILDQGRRVHILFRDNKSKNLMVFFHGAMPEDVINSYTLPVFSGVKIADNADADRLLISDTTLSLSKDNLKLGWFTGSAEYNFFNSIQAVINKFASSYNRVIFIGGSGGGFASLRASALTPGSTALIWNPQTDIAKYHRKAVSHYGQECFGNENFEAIDPEIRATRHSNLCDLYAQPRENRIIYFQNGPDSLHVRKHAGPFLEAYGKANGLGYPAPTFGLFGRDLLHVQGRWPGGHKPPPQRVLVKTIDTFLAAGDQDGLAAVQRALSHEKYTSLIFQ